MYSAVLLVSMLSGFGHVSSEFSKTCQTFRPTDTFDESECVSRTWYLYAANTPCENCCMIRNMTLLEPGLISVTYTLKIGQETTVKNYIARKLENNSAYLVKQKNPTLFIAIDADCQTYASFYSPNENCFQVFTTQKKKEQSFLDSLSGVKQCNMELHLYNPELSC